MQSELKFWSLDIYFDIQIISFISLSVGDTTVYWGGSLIEKIITRTYFIMQSAYFINFRSRHENSYPCKIMKITVPNLK